MIRPIGLTLYHSTEKTRNCLLTIRNLSVVERLSWADQSTQNWGTPERRWAAYIWMMVQRKYLQVNVMYCDLWPLSFLALTCAWSIQSSQLLGSSSISLRSSFSPTRRFLLLNCMETSSCHLSKLGIIEWISNTTSRFFRSRRTRGENHPPQTLSKNGGNLPSCV